MRAGILLDAESDGPGLSTTACDCIARARVPLYGNHRWLLPARLQCSRLLQILVVMYPATNVDITLCGGRHLLLNLHR